MLMLIPVMPCNDDDDDDDDDDAGDTLCNKKARELDWFVDPMAPMPKVKSR
jgi:hypothetical protein